MFIKSEPKDYRSTPAVRARFRGCLLGGAVGDALGGPVEFLSWPEIQQRFGAQGITDYEAAWGGRGRITDDTQMTLFTAEGLLRAWVRGATRGITTIDGVTAHAYQRWLLTQGIKNRHGCLIPGESFGWLFSQMALHQQRAPGNTCLNALREMTSLGLPAENNSKGCGGVMRMAPVGLYYCRGEQPSSPRRAFDVGVRLSALTHAHPSGNLTGGVLAVIVLHLVEGKNLPEAIELAIDLLVTRHQFAETLNAIELALELAQQHTAPEAAFARLGEGWVAEEALAIALYCALMATSFEHGVLMAVNHGGDSDSTGAIAGNLLGAIYGVEAIPSRWLQALELAEVIQEIADDLLEYPQWGQILNGPRKAAEALTRKYPGD